MTPQPPSFQPDRRRERPSSDSARPAAQSPAQQAQAQREARRPSAGEAKRPGAAAASEPPIVRQRPRVVGIAADDAQARQWRVDTGQSSGEAPKPLMPTTADQPKKDLPPSFAPVRRGASGRGREAQQPPRTFRVPASGAERIDAARAARSAAAPSRPAPRPLRPLPGQQAAPSLPPRPVPRRRGRAGRRMLSGLLALILLAAAWAAFLMWDADQNLGRTQALSGAAGTPGTTYLLAGSDSRADGAVKDGFEGGERSDSIMLVNIAPNGQTVALSIPRDTFTKIPGHGWDKINSAYAYGGSALLVEAVEGLTGLTVDHYVQIGMGGVANIVDAVGGVNVCYDGDVTDDPSGLVWSSGCHDVDGTTALAFSRMRYSDPEGDIGRTQRQRQVISKVVSKAMTPATLLNPGRTLKVERAGSASFTVDDSSSVVDVARLALAFRSSGGSGLMGTPPIESLNYTTDQGGSAVLLRGTTADDFFAKLRSGSLTTRDLNLIDE